MERQVGSTLEVSRKEWMGTLAYMKYVTKLVTMAEAEGLRVTKVTVEYMRDRQLQEWQMSDNYEADNGGNLDG